MPKHDKGLVIKYLFWLIVINGEVPTSEFVSCKKKVDHCSQNPDLNPKIQDFATLFTFNNSNP